MRILAIGDGRGMPQLLKYLPKEHVCGLVAGKNRPQFHDEIGQLARGIGAPFLIQPVPAHPGYASFRQSIQELKPDLIWVNSYSMIVRDDILAIPRLGGINIHGALLPQYRGCNPTQWAILNGESETGVTLHEMVAGPDEGDILDQRTVPLRFEDTWVDVFARVAEATDLLIAENLPRILAGKWEARRQDQAQARNCRRRTPEDGQFRWEQPVLDIYNLVRALVSPHPGAFCIDDRQGKVILDGYLSPAELAALKYAESGRFRLQARQVRLRPEPLGTTDVIPFGIEKISTGKSLGTGRLVDIDWIMRTAALQADVAYSHPFRDEAAAEALELMAGFGESELKLRRMHVHGQEEMIARRTWEK